jgi:hypothetical protein
LKLTPPASPYEIRYSNAGRKTRITDIKNEDRCPKDRISTALYQSKHKSLELSLLVHYTILIGEGSNMSKQRPKSNSTDITEAISDTERIDLIANLVLDIITEEQDQLLKDVSCQDN